MKKIISVLILASFLLTGCNDKLKDSFVGTWKWENKTKQRKIGTEVIITNKANQYFVQIIDLYKSSPNRIDRGLKVAELKGETLVFKYKRREVLFSILDSNTLLLNNKSKYPYVRVKK